VKSYFLTALALTTLSNVSYAATDIAAQKPSNISSYFTLQRAEKLAELDKLSKCNSDLDLGNFNRFSGGLYWKSSRGDYKEKNGCSNGFFTEIYKVNSISDVNAINNPIHTKLEDDFYSLEDYRTDLYTNEKGDRLPKVPCAYFVGGLWDSKDVILRNPRQASGRIAFCFYQENGVTKFDGAYWATGSAKDQLFLKPEIDGSWHGTVQQ